MLDDVFKKGAKLRIFAGFFCVIRILESDFKDTSEDSKKVSQDDILFLNKV